MFSNRISRYRHKYSLAGPYREPSESRDWLAGQPNCIGAHQSELLLRTPVEELVVRVAMSKKWKRPNLTTFQMAKQFNLWQNGFKKVTIWLIWPFKRPNGNPVGCWVRWLLSGPTNTNSAEDFGERTIDLLSANLVKWVLCSAIRCRYTVKNMRSDEEK